MGWVIYSCSFSVISFCSCIAVLPLASSSLVSGREILPSGRMTTVVVSSGCFHTKTSITSSGPRRYSGTEDLAAYVALRTSAALAAGIILARTRIVVSTAAQCIIGFTRTSLCFTDLPQFRLAPTLYSSISSKRVTINLHQALHNHTNSSVVIDYQNRFL